MRVSARLSRGELQTSELSAKINALLERNASSVDFRDVADNCEAKPGAWLTGRVEPCSAGKELPTPVGRDPRPIVLDLDVDHLALGLDGNEHPASAIFRCIL